MKQRMPKALHKYYISYESTISAEPTIKKKAQILAIRKWEARVIKNQKEPRKRLYTLIHLEWKRCTRPDEIPKRESFQK